MEHVAIFGVPRSGTNWIGQIFNSSPQVLYRHQPLFSYSFDGYFDEDSSSKEIEKIYSKLCCTTDPYVCQKQNISGNSTPDFFKTDITHLVWKEVRYLNVIPNLLEQSETKIVGIIRNPCGVINSWFTAPKEFDKEWEELEEWRNATKKNKDKYHFFGFERWLEAVNLFLELEKAYPDRFYIQVYEDLLQNTGSEIKKLFNFADLAVTHQTEAFLEKSTSSPTNDPYGVFRSPKTGYEWIDTLDPEIIEQIYSDERFEVIRKKIKWKTPSEV
jgi:hypothetical protein